MTNTAANDTNYTAEALENLRQTVNKASETLCSAAFGLCTIADLLGSNANDYGLNDRQTYGLANAALALGELVKETSTELWSITSTDPEARS